uniref:Cd3gd protein n=1 Tax=Melanocetus johnsonii TaxID=242962 RepID=A0A7S8WI94_MELJO|nr:Cd3gd protein [Melanocetus johnsonii]
MRTGLSVCLLLWMLTEAQISVKSVSDGIVLSCRNKNVMKSSNGETVEKLSYSDDNTGEYRCERSDGSDGSDGSLGGDGAKIYVKFRTCDNCIEFNLMTITGLVVGDLVATVVILVAVCLMASQSHTGPTTSHKKSSDWQLLVPNEVSSRASNDHYQELTHKRDVYDVLTNRR